MRRPPSLLWAAAIAAASIGLVLLIGLLIGGRDPFGFDRAITAGLRIAGDPGRPIGPRWLEGAMIDVTALGGTTVLTLASLAAIALLAARRLWLTAALVAAATASGALLVTCIKLHVGRARPDIVDHLVEVSGMSFPSGHAANSAIVYLTIAALGTQVVRGAATRNVLLALAVLLVGAIGFSRIYLGVHWASDVLAGWCFGTLWAGAWWLVGARIRPARPAYAPTPARR